MRRPKQHFWLKSIYSFEYGPEVLLHVQIALPILPLIGGPYWKGLLQTINRDDAKQHTFLMLDVPFFMFRIMYHLTATKHVEMVV